MSDASAAERLLCDTSFVALSAKRSVEPQRFAQWPANIIARVDRAILAISVITLAEVGAIEGSEQAIGVEHRR